MPTLYIVRGLPGSGKSTFARELQAKTGALFVEPDMFLMSDGEYHYSEQQYKWAKTDAVGAMLAAVHHSADVIYADVLPRQDEIAFLIHNTNKFSETLYQVKVFTIEITPDESKKRNVHNVRHTDIDRMVSEWEDWPGETVINGTVRNGTEGTEVKNA